MRGRRKRLMTLAGLWVCLLLSIGTSRATNLQLIFTSGPDGGTFQYFSNGIASRLTHQVPGWELNQRASAGSLENIRRIHAGEADFGIAYSGDVFLAFRGNLDQDPSAYGNVLAVAYLYGAPAHLVVRGDSDIDSVEDLAGRRIAVGGAGSGAAASAQRYFTALGLWPQLEVEFIGYTKAAQALLDKKIDAMWIMAGYPNTSVLQAAAKGPVRLLDTWAAGERAGVFREYPFYAPLTIPAGTYRGMDKDVASFQDSAIWIAGKHVPDEVVHRALAEIFSPEGLAYMVKVKSTAREMSVKSGLTGIVTQVHPGARAFWKEQGMGFIPGE